MARISDERMNKIRDQMIAVETEIKKVMFGVDQIVKFSTLAIFSREHLLFDGVPGTAKTLLARAFAQVMGGDFVRIQGKPDVTPERLQIIGEPGESGTLKFYRSKLLTHNLTLCIILLDEFTRFITQTQAYWFDLMAEHLMTLANDTQPYPHARIIATKNKITRGEAFDIPPPMFDRFLINLETEYPDTESEVRLLDDEHKDDIGDMIESLNTIMELPDLEACVDDIQKTVYVGEAIRRYIVDIGNATRHPSQYGIAMEGVHDIDAVVSTADGGAGLSTRALKKLKRLAKVVALRDNSDKVLPRHILEIAHIFMSHRIIVNDMAAGKRRRGSFARDFIKAVMDKVPVPQGYDLG